MLDMGSARHWAHEMIRQVLSEGGRVIDATMGNGGDTLLACELVGECGWVYAFDVQQAALDATRARLEAANLLERAQLILAGHERVCEFVQDPVDAAIFNLGWLPGVPERLTTQTETTLRAVNDCLTLLRKGGLLSVCVYPGHEEGAREYRALMDWAQKLDSHKYQAMVKAYLNQPPAAPALIAVQPLK